ncbi:MAG: AMP-binding protein [Rubrivivax sp.]|nr:AMP-binding protein [Rubrivivax sp.]
MTHLTYFETFEPRELLAEYPLGEAFTQRVARMSRDELRALQNQRFLRLVARAWQLPFYQRLWGAQGIEAADIRSLDDIVKLPSFGKQEVMDSVALRPPLGDFHGQDVAIDGHHWPMVLHTTSGTTGRPQPLLFSPRSREVQALLLARIYRLQGLQPGEVMHSVYGHGMINGGHYVREAVLHYTHALLITPGTGVETPSARQVELMRDFGVNVIVGFADYIKRLADVAREQGIQPGRDIPVRRICGHLGRESRETLSQAWGGAQMFDWYGVGDTGAVAGEGPDHDGLYLMEDAQYVEVADVDSGQPVADGLPGDIVVTCLYKDDIYPIIRFNTHDVTQVLTTPSALGFSLRRIAGFLGRSDNMVKVRGINVFPQALGPILEERADFAGEFLCTARRDASGRDELIVALETRGARDEAAAAPYRDLLKRRLGVEVRVDLVAPGSLAPLTGTETRQKPIRLIDERFS